MLYFKKQFVQFPPTISNNWSSLHPPCKKSTDTSHKKLARHCLPPDTSHMTTLLHYNFDLSSVITILLTSTTSVGCLKAIILTSLHLLELLKDAW